MYDLVLVRQTDNLFDYDIVFDNTKIGALNITDKEDSVFIRHIDILPEHRRCDHAKNILEHLFKISEKDISFCIATNSESAVKFWNKILEKKDHIHIRGNIYQLQITQNLKQIFI